MLQHLRRKVLPILLVLIMLFCTMGATNEIPMTIGKTTMTENGITYYIQGAQCGNKTKVTIKTSKDCNYSEIIVDKQNKTVASTNYDYKGKDFFGISQYSKKTEKANYSSYDRQKASSVSLEAITYKSVVYEQWPVGNDYWYCRGTDVKKTYIKIGRIASYSIRTDNLSSNKFTMCENYISAILNCNTAVNTAIASDVLCIFGCVCGIVAAFTGPIGVLIAAATFATGCSAALVYKAVEAYGYYCTAADKYEAIKTYGTKL